MQNVCSFNNLCNAGQEVNETDKYYRLLLGLQSPTLTFGFNPKQLKIVHKYNYMMWVTWIGHVNGLLLTTNEICEGRTL